MLADATASDHLPTLTPDDAVRHLALASIDSEAPAPSSPAVVVSSGGFRAFYEGHVDFVWRNLRRLGIPTSEVDDRTQEVFVIAHRRLASFEDRGHGARAWLYQIALRVASDARRHRRRHPEDPDGGDWIQNTASEATQGDAIARREKLALLDRALQKIEVARRAVLVLHEIEEMTAPEIAAILEIPLNTVYSRLRVARKELELALAAEARGKAMESGR